MNTNLELKRLLRLSSEILKTMTRMGVDNPPPEREIGPGTVKVLKNIPGRPTFPRLDPKPGETYFYDVPEIKSEKMKKIIRGLVQNYWRIAELRKELTAQKKLVEAQYRKKIERSETVLGERAKDLWRTLEKNTGVLQDLEETFRRHMNYCVQFIEGGKVPAPPAEFPPAEELRVVLQFIEERVPAIMGELQAAVALQRAAYEAANAEEPVPSKREINIYDVSKKTPKPKASLFVVAGIDDALALAQAASKHFEHALALASGDEAPEVLPVAARKK